jgi:hypothetical protein
MRTNTPTSLPDEDSERKHKILGQLRRSRELRVSQTKFERTLCQDDFLAAVQVRPTITYELENIEKELN